MKIVYQQLVREINFSQWPPKHRQRCRGFVNLRVRRKPGRRLQFKKSLTRVCVWCKVCALKVVWSIFCGLEKRSSRHAHNVKIASSNLAPAKFFLLTEAIFYSRVLKFFKMRSTPQQTGTGLLIRLGEVATTSGRTNFFLFFLKFTGLQLNG